MRRVRLDSAPWWVVCVALVMTPGTPPRSAHAATALEAVAARFESLMERGALDEATALCDSALSTVDVGSAAPRELPAFARLLHGRGLLDYFREDFAASASWMGRAHAVVVRAVEEGQVHLGSFAAEVTSDHAELLRLDGDSSGAEQAMREAVSLAAQHAPDSQLHAVTLNNLAGLLKDRSAYAAAEELLERALRITEHLEADTGERLATAHLNLAEVYRLQDRHDFAEPHYVRALDLARATLGDENPDLVYFLAQMATLRSEQGRHEAATTLRREALALLERAPRATRFLEAELVRASAEDMLATSHGAETTAMFRRCLALQEDLFGPDHWIAAESRLGLARSLSLEGRGRGIDEALAHLDLAIGATTEAAPEVLVKALGLHAELLRRRGRTGDALDDLGRAIDRVEQLRVLRGGGERSRALLLGGHVDLYHATIDLLIDRGDLDAAFRTVERMRARTLVDELERSELDLRADLPSAVRDSFESLERSARGRLAQHQEALRGLSFGTGGEDEAASLRAHQFALDQALSELRDVQEKMLRRSPRWRAILESARDVLAIEEAQQLVGPRGVMLVYAIGATRSHVFEVPPQGEPVRVHELTVGRSGRVLGIGRGPLTREAIHQALREVRENLLCTKPGCAKQRDATLFALADIVVPRVLRSRLRSSELILVAPDGALNELPFEALLLGERADGTPRSWLADFGPTLYASSATTLRGLRAREARIRAGSTPEIAVLTVSDPDFTAFSAPSGPQDSVAVPGPRIRVEPLRSGVAMALPPLPGTRRESAAITEAFEGRAVIALQGAGASEQAVRHWAPRAQYLHLATHGLATWSGPSAFASLVLTPPEVVADATDDGLLQLFEIRDLALYADLAVLSACETAVGERIEGEGVFALSRGFLAAGASRVVASLWAVNDRATATLVSELFRGLVAAEREATPGGVARQLRLAKLHLAVDARTAAPFYWAPFVLLGVD